MGQVRRRRFSRDDDAADKLLMVEPVSGAERREDGICDVVTASTMWRSNITQ